LTEPGKILIVDDEPLARQRVARYVRQFDPGLLIETAADGLEAVEKIRSFKPDLVFLDIEMPGLNGFEVLQQFDERPFQIIFQTAYDQFAIRAFEEQAIDYLLKPFNAERLHRALSNALRKRHDETRLRKLEDMLAGRSPGAGYLNRLTVSQGRRLRLVDAGEIWCFISKDHYTHVCFGAGLEGICELSLNRLAERLDPARFMRVHRNSIVRIESIESCGSAPTSGMWIELRNGMKLEVSRSRQGELRRMIKDEK